MAYNANGLSNPIKFRSLIKFIKSYNLPDIIIATDARRFNLKRVNYLIPKCYDSFINKAVYKNALHPSRGVIILIKKTLSPRQIKADESGNFLLLEAQINFKSFKVAGIYGPNEKNEEFYKMVSRSLRGSPNIIVGGDLNVDLDKNKNPNVSFVKKLAGEFEFVDIGAKHKRRTYSAINRNGVRINKRLDYVLVSSTSLEGANSDLFTLPKFISDHSPIGAEITFSGSTVGRWKINNKLLASESLSRNIRAEIELIKDRMTRKLISPEDALFHSEDAARKILKIEGARIAKEKRRMIELIHQKGLEEINADGARLRDYQEIINADNDGIILRSKIRDLAVKTSGKNSFKHLEKAITVDKGIKELFDAHGNLLTSSDKIEERANDFYKQLFECSECKISRIRNGSNLTKCKYCARWAALGSPPLPNLNNLPKNKPITDRDNDTLGEEISINDIKRMVANYNKKNKSPGSSGLSFEFYKKFIDVLAPILYGVFKNAKSTGALPEFVSEGVITLIPKPKKDKRMIENYRPITLLNTSYKIYSTILNDRLEKLIPKIISPNQKGFVKGKRAEDLVRSIQDTFDNDKTSSIIMIDFQKAFDSLSHKFIFERLTKLGFKKDFVDMIAVTMCKVKAKLEVGSSKRKFNLSRGAKQGDSLSCALFIISVEQLYRKINSCGGIKSPRIGKRTLKSVLYADDLSVMVAGDIDSKKDSIDCLLILLEKFAKSSGLKVNINKTEIISRPGDEIGNRFPQFKKANHATLLGFAVGTNAREQNSEKIKEDLTKKVQFYKKFHFNKFDKIQCWNINILSKVSHRLRMIPFNKELAQEIDEIRHDFLWEEKRPYISAKRLTSPTATWGLGLIETSIHWKTLNFSWFTLIRSSRDHWASRIKERFKSNLGTKFDNRIQIGPTEMIGTIKLINEFWSDMAISWTTLARHATSLLNENQPLNSNPLLTGDNRFEFHNDAFSLVDLPLNFTTQNVFVNSNLNAIRKEKVGPPTPFFIAIETITNKRLKSSIQSLLNPLGAGLVQDRLTRYNPTETPPTPSSDHLLKNPLLSSEETWLRYKLVTSSLKLNAQIGDNDRLCQICNNHLETTEHLFFDCNNVRDLINYSNEIIKAQFDYTTSKTDWLCTTLSAKFRNEIEKVLAKTQIIIFGARFHSSPIPISARERIDEEIVLFLNLNK